MKYFFENYIYFEKHNSFYFNIPAHIMVLIAYILPGILGSINVDFSVFGSITLLVIAIFDKKSKMVRFYCLQYCFASIISNILLTIASLICKMVPPLTAILGILSLIVGLFMVFVFIYSIVSAFKYKGWKVPYVGDFILEKILKY